jgi:hypothetical protein
MKIMQAIFYHITIFSVHSKGPITRIEEVWISQLGKQFHAFTEPECSLLFPQ